MKNTEQLYLLPLSQPELFEYHQQKQKQGGRKIYPIIYYGHYSLYQKSIHVSLKKLCNDKKYAKFCLGLLDFLM